MTVNQFIRKLLNLKELSVVGFHLDTGKHGALDLFVKPYKNGCLCPHCRRRCPIIRTREDARMWRDPPIYGRGVRLWYPPREVQCPTHGRVQEVIPWADRFAQVTYRFEYLLHVFCQIMTQKAAARVLHMAASTLSDLLHRAISRLREGHRITSRSGRGSLTGFSTVILDEIHAVVPSAGRLAHERGGEARAPVRRVSADRPVGHGEAAGCCGRFCGGGALESHGGEGRYSKRDVFILESREPKACTIQVCQPEGAGDEPGSEAWWAALARALRRTAERNRSTIFFVNSRHMCEKVARLINEEMTR